MERRYLLGITFGLVAGAAALAVGAQAAPLPPIPAQQAVERLLGSEAEPAVASQDEIDRLKPEQVRWGHHWHHHHWHHRHWGWHHRHWGWRHHHWHHRHW
jgi:hypothetical protein